MAEIHQQPLTLDQTFEELLQFLGEADGDKSRFKQAVEKAREAARSAETLQQLIENVHEVLWITDWKKREELYVSKSYESIWGRTCASLYADARSWLDSVHPEDRQRVQASFARNAERGQYCEEYRIIHPDGSIRWIYDRSIPIYDDNGCVYRMAGISEDITERKVAAEHLREAHAQLEHRVEQRTAALTAVNQRLASQEAALRRVVDGTSSKVGEEFLHSVVRHLAGALGVHFAFVSEVIDLPNRRLRLLSYWNHDHLDTPFTYDPSGTPCEVVLKNRLSFYPHGVRDRFPRDEWLKRNSVESYLAVPLCDTSGVTIGHMGVSHTGPMENSETAQSIIQIFATRVVAEIERRRAEQDKVRLRDKLYQAQKMKAVGELASGVAHDFNNLLLVMFAGIDQLHEVASGEPARAALLVVERAAREAHEVTKALISASRAAPPATERLDMLTVLETLPEVLQLMLPTAIKLEIKNDVHTPCWTAGDSSQLRHVIINVVANARDAMPSGGQLTLSLAPATPQDCRSCDLEATRPWVAIVVTDTGQGMTPDTLSRIFEPFFTTKTRTKSTGLGLTIAHRIIGDHGGHINLDSQVGRGTQVTILLPHITEM